MIIKFLEHPSDPFHFEPRKFFCGSAEIQKYFGALFFGQIQLLGRAFVALAVHCRWFYTQLGCVIVGLNNTRAVPIKGLEEPKMGDNEKLLMKSKWPLTNLSKFCFN